MGNHLGATRRTLINAAHELGATVTETTESVQSKTVVVVCPTIYDYLVLGLRVGPNRLIERREKAWSRHLGVELKIGADHPIRNVGA